MMCGFDEFDDFFVLVLVCCVVYFYVGYDVDCVGVFCDFDDFLVGVEELWWFWQVLVWNLLYWSVCFGVDVGDVNGVEVGCCGYECDEFVGGVLVFWYVFQFVCQIECFFVECCVYGVLYFGDFFGSCCVVVVGVYCEQLDGVVSCYESDVDVDVWVFELFFLIGD